MSPDPEDLLIRELRERSGDVEGTSVSFHDVRRTAHGMRRRRNAVSGAVAAVMAAVALPSGLAVTGAFDDEPAPDGSTVASSPTAATPTPEPTPRPDGAFTLTVEGLPDGAPSGLDYVVPGEKKLVTPEGTLDLPEAYSMITRYADGWLALAESKGAEGGMDVVTLDEDFAESNRERSAGMQLVLDEDRTSVAYTVVDESGERLLVDAPTDGRDVTTWTVPDDLVDPVGHAGDGAIVFATEGETFDSYLAQVGQKPARIRGFLRMGAVSDANGLMAGMLSYDDLTAEACWAVTEAGYGAGDLLWRTCDYEPADFSPDGQLVLAYPGYRDANGPTSMYVLDAYTGEVLTEFSPERGGRTVVAVWQAAWEDADSILALVEEGGDMRMVRAGVDGSLEAVSDVYRPRNMGYPLWIADVPRS